MKHKWEDHNEFTEKICPYDNADFEEDYDEMYVMPDDIRMEMPGDDADDGVSSLDSPSRKEPEIQPVSADKVSLKLLQPKSHTEATKIADKLKEGCIVLLDISNLARDQARRLVDFLAGVAYVLGGEMIKTNKSTIVVSPAGVDISGFAPQEEPVAAEEPAETVEEEGAEEEYEAYEEIPAGEE